MIPKIFILLLISSCSLLEDIIKNCMEILQDKINNEDYQRINLKKPMVFMTLNDTNISIEYNGLIKSIELVDCILKDNTEYLYIQILHILDDFNIEDSEKYLLIKNVYKADREYPELSYFLRNFDSLSHSCLTQLKEGNADLVPMNIFFTPVIYSDRCITKNNLDSFYSSTDCNYYCHIVSSNFVYIINIPISHFYNTLRNQRVDYIKSGELLGKVIDFNDRITVEEILIQSLNTDSFITQSPAIIDSLFLKHGIGHFVLKKQLDLIFKHAPSCYKILSDQLQDSVFYVSVNEFTVFINNRKYTTSEHTKGRKISKQVYKEITDYFKTLNNQIGNDFLMKIILKSRYVNPIIKLILSDRDSSDFIIFLNLLRMGLLISEEELIYFLDTPIILEIERSVYQTLLISVYDRISQEVLMNNVKIEYFYIQLFIYQKISTDLVEFRDITENLLSLKKNISESFLTAFDLFNRYLSGTLHLSCGTSINE